MNIVAIKRKNGVVYRARVGGRGNRVSKYFLRKSDAQIWIAKMKVELSSLEEGETYRPIQTAKTESVQPHQPCSLKEIYGLFQKGYAEIHQEPGTRYREAKIVEQHLVPYFGNQDVNRLSQRDIQQYLYSEFRKRELKPATLNKHFQVLHKVFAWAAKNGLMDKNPAAGVSRIPVQDSVYSPNFKFLEEKDLHNALAKVRELYPKEYPVILTAVTCGLRAGEVCGLQQKDLIESGKTPVLLIRRTYCCTIRDFKETTKGGNARVVPVSDALLEVLKSIADEKRPNDLLFFRDKAEAIRIRNTLHKKWTRAQRLCGLTPRTFHALRHTYATLFLSHGGSPFALQRILGHSNAKITDKYSHFSQQLMEISRNVVQLPDGLKKAV